MLPRGCPLTLRASNGKAGGSGLRLRGRAEHQKSAEKGNERQDQQFHLSSPGCCLPFFAHDRYVGNAYRQGRKPDPTGPECDHEFVIAYVSLSPSDAAGGEAAAVGLRGGVRRAPTVPRTRWACSPWCAAPCCQDILRHRSRCRRDPRCLRSGRRAVGRHRVAPAVPRGHRQCEGAGLCPDHRRMEAATGTELFGDAAAPRQGQLDRLRSDPPSPHLTHDNVLWTNPLRRSVRNHDD